MPDPYRLIHLGIGEQIGTLDAFILVGLNVSAASTGIRELEIKRSIALDVDTRLQDTEIGRGIGLDVDTRLQTTEIRRMITTEAENG